MPSAYFALASGFILVSLMFSFLRSARSLRVHSNLQYRDFKPPRRFAHNNANLPSIYKPRRERFITPTMVLIGFIPIFTFALGTWQLGRLKWKVNLIDELEEKLQLPPLELPKRIKYVTAG